MIGFIVDTEFVWGFQARVVGLSKTSPSFYYPPPTTFLGALAEVIAKENGIGESKGREVMAKLSEKLLAIGVKPLNCKPIKYEDLNRIIAVKITSGVLYPNPSDFAKSFDSPARGKTVLTSFEGPPTLRWFIVFGDSNLNLNGKQKKISGDLFWKIHRLGSKESVVSVTEVRSFEPEKVEGRIKTTYSFPSKNVEILKEETPRNWVYEVYTNPFEFSDPVRDYIEGRNILPFKVPIMNRAKEEYHCWLDVKVAYRFEDEVVVGWLR